MNTLEGIEEFAQRLSAYGDEVRAVVESPRGICGSRSTTGSRITEVTLGSIKFYKDKRKKKISTRIF